MGRTSEVKYMKTIRLNVKTTAHTQMVDVTDQIQKAVTESGVREGICTVFVPHTTAAVTINENADPDVVRDFTMEINKIVPWEDGYRHMEGNSAAHLKSSMIGFSEQVIIEDGRLLPFAVESANRDRILVYERAS